MVLRFFVLGSVSSWKSSSDADSLQFQCDQEFGNSFSMAPHVHAIGMGGIVSFDGDVYHVAGTRKIRQSPIQVHVAPTRRRQST